jgi:hypothetical protein
LRNTRRIDTNLFKKVRLSLQEDKKEKAAGLHTEDEQYRIDRHERIVICNNDNLKLLELNKIIEERIGSLREEVEIATNVKLNP